MTLVKRKPKKSAKTPAPAQPDTRDEGFEIVMIPIEDLVPDDDNPNEMDETTFDMLIEEIRAQGFDEPILVRKHPTAKGKYQIGSGHHRTKAAMIVGYTELPCVIKKWTDREQKAALAKRNALRGDLNKEKLVRIYKELSKGRDPVLVQRELGFADTKKFEKLYDAAKASLPPKQAKKLSEAKEKIKSIDDLSSVLNRIFKEAGSELDKGYMVFSFGGKNHHYFQIGADTEAKLQAILRHCEQEGVVYTDYVQSIVMEHDLPDVLKPAKKKPGSKTRKRK